MNYPADIPAFKTYRNPTDADAIARARSQILTGFAQLDISLAVASASIAGNSNGWLLFRIAGTSLYVDNNPALGNGNALLQFNSQQDAGGATFYCQPGQAWEQVTYTQIALSWAAQPGKTLRLMYSMDGRVFPSSAGNSYTATIANVAANAVPVVEGGFTYGVNFKSTTVLAVGAFENVWAAAANVNGALVHSASYWSATSADYGQINMTCKATLPTTPVDGTILMASNGGGSGAGARWVSIANLPRAVNVPAGLRADFGLFGGTTEIIAYRNVLYSLK